MTAPTVAEIRAAIHDRIHHGDHYGSPDEWVAYASDGIRALWPRHDADGDLGDVHPRLGELLEAAEADIREQCIEVAIERFTAAGVQFAIEHPDEPADRSLRAARVPA